MCDNTVAKAENLTRAAVTSAGIHFFHCSYKKLLDYLDIQSVSPNPIRRIDGSAISSYDIHAIRGDSSNSSDYRSYKIFASELWGAFGIPLFTDDGGAVMKHDAGLIFPDLAWVTTSNDCAAQKRLWEEKVRHYGVVTWDQYVSLVEASIPLLPHFCVACIT